MLWQKLAPCQQAVELKNWGRGTLPGVTITNNAAAEGCRGNTDTSREGWPVLWYGSLYQPWPGHAAACRTCVCSFALGNVA